MQHMQSQITEPQRHFVEQLSFMFKELYRVERSRNIKRGIAASKLRHTKQKRLKQ